MSAAKVYIVTSENWECSEIEGVFSTKPKAERLRKLLDRDGTSDDHFVSEWVIDARDEFAQRGMLVWDVAITADEDILWASSRKDKESPEEATLLRDGDGRLIFEIECFARDDDEAIIVAQQRVERLIAAGEFWIEDGAHKRQLPMDVMRKVIATNGGKR